MHTCTHAQMHKCTPAHVHTCTHAHTCNIVSVLRPHLGSTAAPAVALRTVASVSLPSAAPIVAIIPAAPRRLRNRNSTTTTTTTTATTATTTLTSTSPGWCCEGSSDSLRPRPAKAPRVTGDASGTPAALMVFSDGSMWTLGVCKTRGPFFPSSGGR
eukprot:GHVU01095995.1.p3 GENE.GHVU01095995.1~~GHVU01095995.1.p3  ORF type:complete len:157 (-),score=13.47 GHVU01095995.1:124-594(-)